MPIFKSVRRYSWCIPTNYRFLNSYFCTKVDSKNNYGNGHVYRRVGFWESRSALCSELEQNILYNEDGLVVLNKPYGLGGAYNLFDVLPYLSKVLGYSTLSIIHAPERYTSGLTLLAANENTKSKVKQAILRSEGELPPQQTFLTLGIGHPIIDSGSNKFGLKKEAVNNIKYPVIIRNWSNQQLRRNELRARYFSHSVFTKNDLASVINISTWLTTYFAVRVFLSDVLLCPALGDQKFGSRVTELLGKKVWVNPWQALGIKYLSKDMMKSLLLNNGEEENIPMHLHLQELRLRGYPEKNTELVLQAPPPKYFLWSCEKLGLSLPSTITWRVNELNSSKDK